MTTWDPHTEADNRRREVAIAVALLREASEATEPAVLRRLARAAAMHLESANGTAVERHTS